MTHSIAVFCGSAVGTDTIFLETARHVGKTLAQQGKTLVYGGGRSGLMGVIADSALQAGGRVIGVIPHALVDRELAHPDLTELHVVKNMHERKTKMSELSDAFIALPGGAGTLEEIFEQWTWAQLGIHLKPCAFLNVHGFYDDLIKFINLTTEKGFTHSRFTETLIAENSVEAILQQFDVFTAPTPKWGMSEQQDLVKHG
ncbi:MULTISPECIES: TIGR00730 family Rossman fold protein [Acinetobacter]|uniref:Cytokinin riboside 5'-monophosphate phosphoribohydrolase n=1 Tax=Acinetobacter tibetensis TaxID=2943497 RepID=A0AAE9LS48_9GAMM|nr:MULTISPECIES: TIGR00730 family Rossman fold protein [Acinetobacter]PWB14678.1 TIGR00730 family Rossman fold protein [Acinetobacter sp. AM]USE83576.1 TIGR00730 family Rossman fold protein [Acinetobacter tibetensis]HEX5381485.1 TIGR00730 family Rossman fold protein [Acinetobacter sp.]